MVLTYLEFYCQAFVETYWESWVYKDYPNDYCAQLKEVPASSIGSITGANYINIGKLFHQNLIAFVH